MDLAGLLYALLVAAAVGSAGDIALHPLTPGGWLRDVVVAGAGGIAGGTLMAPRDPMIGGVQALWAIVGAIVAVALFELLLYMLRPGKLRRG